MSLPRTKPEIQSQWRQWVDDYAVAQGWNADQKGVAFLLTAREIDWMLTNNNLEQDIGRRLQKIAAMQGAAIDPADLDPDWVVRTAFLSWMLTP